MHIRRKKRVYYLLISLSGLLVSLLTACDQPGPNTVGSSTPPVVQTPHSSTTSPMPATETTCPTNGTARPAVMRYLALSKAASLVYLFNKTTSASSTGSLKSYNVKTGQKAQIVELPGTTIIHAQVSADGRWVLFLSDVQGTLELQLIRVDGQGLQTLYCLPSADYTYNNPSNILATVQWSPDQNSALISAFANRTTNTITLLNLATGTLKTELSLSAQPDITYYYSVLKWLNNTQAYITRTAFGAPAPAGVLYLLDIVKNKDTQGGSLKQLLEYQQRLSFSSLDSSQDRRKLFVSYCLVAANPFDTTLSVGPAIGNQQHMIYHQKQSTCIHEMRVATTKALLLFMEIYNGSNVYDHQVWTMNTDGTNRKVLVDTQASEYVMNRFTQCPWSNVSRDGSMYALGPNHYASTPAGLVIGSLSGGPLTTFDSTTDASLDIVGWTMA